MPTFPIAASPAWHAAAFVALCAMPAHAQLIDHAAVQNRAAYVQSERTIAIGISLPIGRQRRDSAPRIDLHLQRNRMGADGARINAGPGTGALRISRSLDQQPQWFINQQRVTAGEQRTGVSTLGAVAIGAGVALAFVASYSL